MFFPHLVITSPEIFCNCRSALDEITKVKQITYNSSPKFYSSVKHIFRVGENNATLLHQITTT